MAFSNAGSGAPGPQMNVTPLIDVLLTIIIIFMVAVIKTPDKGLKALIPQPAEAGKPPAIDRTIVIRVMSNDPDQGPSLKINQEDVSWENLKGRLLDIFKARAERVAFVEGSPGVDFQYVADVIDIAHHAGVERMGLLSSDEARVRPAR
jgi:biopolymer transport protein TolR